MLFASCAITAFSVHAETVTCSKEIEAFDPADTLMIVGRFSPGTQLEVDETSLKNGYFQVTYKTPEGQIVKAQCRAGDLGKNVPVATDASSTKPSSGSGKTKVSDLKEGLKLAEESKKLLFVKCGRAACGNCQALGSMIRSNQVKIPSEEFIFAEVNCDDQKQMEVFRKKFHVSGHTLPFVVVADSSGNQLASHAGYGEPKVFNDLINSAKSAAKK